MNVDGPFSSYWPNQPVGALGKLNGTTWKWVETCPGGPDPSNACYSWYGLDEEVTAAQQYGLTIIYSFEAVPSWAGPAPNMAPSNWTYLSDFATALATRYKGKIQYYEEFNEPDSNGSWNDTYANLVTFGQTVYQSIKAVDPNALVGAPTAAIQVYQPATSPTTGASNFVAWMQGYFQAGGNKYADFAGWHPYACQIGKYGCDSTIGCDKSSGDAIDCASNVIYNQYDQYRTMLNSVGLTNIPLLDTEAGWSKDDGDGFCPTYTTTACLQSVLLEPAYVSRFYIFIGSAGANGTPGVQTAYWYEWGTSGPFDNGGWGTLNGSDGQNPAAGVAYGQVYSWLVGSTFTGRCTAAGTVWSCPLTLAGGTPALLAWDSSLSCTALTCATSTYTAPSTFTNYSDLSGASYVTAGGSVQLSANPILLTSPGMFSPSNGSVLISYAQTFSWYPEPNATAYWLDLGSSQGSNTYLDSGKLSSATTSYSVSDLPTDGSTVWARWYYNIGGNWSYIDYSYVASGGVPGGDTIAQMTSPTPSTTLPGSSATFQWSTGSGPTAYWLDVGSSAKANNYFSQNEGTTTSITVSGLPTDGSTLYVTLYSQINGTWYYNSYTYTAATVALAQMTSPTPGTQFSGGSVPFQWTTGSGATAYYLDVGTSTSVNEYYSQNQGTATSVTVNNLPVDGSTIIVTLYSYINSAWQNNQYTYTAFNAQSSASTMVSPTPGTAFAGSSATFTWNSISGAQAYYLDCGTTANVNLYYSENQGTDTSVSVSTLPTDGSQVVVTLYTQFNGTWYHNTYNYTAASFSKAAMTAPSPGSPLPGPSATFTWTTGSGPTAYYLDIGSTSGGNQYYSQNEGTATSATVNSLPLDGSTVYVTLYSYLNSSWQANHYTYQAAQPAAITSPAPGSSLSGSTQTFNWNAGVSGTEYWVDIGTTSMGNNLYSQDQGSSQTVTVSGLPTDGSTIYVTLYTKISGQWYNNGSVSYTTGP
jgi:hypothetical protein